MEISSEDKSLLSEHVDKVKNYYGNVSYYCNLCNLQFSEKLMLLHCKAKTHQNYLKVVKESEGKSDKFITAKYEELLPTKEEFDAIAKITLDCEESLKLVSDDILNSEHTTNGNGDAKEGEAEQKVRGIFGVMRVGYLAKGLLMKNDSNVQLVLLYYHKPTIQLLKRVSELLTEKLQLVNEGNYLVEAVPDEAFMIVRAKNSNATCKISLTSTLVRPHPFEYYNAQVEADPADMLPADKCMDALREMRRARWFESKVYNLPHSGVVLRILRDLCRRDPHWISLDFWLLENLVEKCLSLSESQLSPSLALLAVMEFIAAGLFMGDTPGFYDPCERQPTDLLANVDSQLLEHITRKAQEAVRLISFGQVEQVFIGSKEIGQNSANKPGVGGSLKRPSVYASGGVTNRDTLKKKK